MLTTPGGAANAPDTQTCREEELLPAEHVELSVKGLGVEVPVHCAFEKRLKFAAVLLVHDRVPNRPEPPWMAVQPMLLKDLTEKLPEQSLELKTVVCR